MSYVGAGNTFYREIMGYDAHDAEYEVVFPLGDNLVEIDVERLGQENLVGASAEFAAGAEGIGTGSSGGVGILYGMNSRGSGPANAATTVAAPAPADTGLHDSPASCVSYAPAVSYTTRSRSGWPGSRRRSTAVSVGSPAARGSHVAPPSVLSRTRPVGAFSTANVRSGFTGSWTPARPMNPGWYESIEGGSNWTRWTSPTPQIKHLPAPKKIPPQTPSHPRLNATRTPFIATRYGFKSRETVYFSTTRLFPQMGIKRPPASCCSGWPSA